MQFKEGEIMQPFADRFRPSKIEDMVGQSHIIGENKVMNRIIQVEIFLI